ncbi:MAG: hypothetical protein CMO74_05130 [Verrucomicrobiales bacterium]|nr:hypothetical protein [Verrucomicrobiales bacterium]
MTEANQQASEAQPSKAGIFVRRFCSASLLWGVLLLGLFYENPAIAKPAFLLIMLLLAGLGLREFFELSEQGGFPGRPWQGTLAGMTMVGGVFLLLALPREPRTDLVPLFEICFLSFFILAVGVRHIFLDDIQGKLGVTIMGVLYVAMLLNFLQLIQFEFGPWFLLFFIVVTKASDTGAYLLGSAIGRHKMLPTISPGKTWEGFAGAILLSVGAAAAFNHFGEDYFSRMPMSHACVVGVVLGVGAVFGDLVESKLKRVAGAKDSGSYFPGIGGILDLLDSLLFNAPMMYLYLKYGMPVS